MVLKPFSWNLEMSHNTSELKPTNVCKVRMYLQNTQCIKQVVEVHSVYANVGQQHNTNFDVDTFELCHNKAYLYHIVLTFNEIRKSVYFQCLKERDDYVCLF